VADSRLAAQRLAAEQQVYARPLHALVARSPVTVSQDLSVALAARRMRAEGVGSLVVVDGEGKPIGIFTSHDLVRAVAAEGSAKPLSEWMTANPASLPGHALAYEAALAMSARSIRHILVEEGGRLAGVVSERDLFALQRLALGQLVMEIRAATDIAALSRLAGEVRGLGAVLVGQGVAAEQLTHFLSVLNDRVSQRAIEIVRRRHDLERLRWCWLAFGSEGRFEQTLATDQDNGLVFAVEDAPADAVRPRLLAFAREVNEALGACGFPLCKGNVMASNPALCLTLEEWRSKMVGWIEAALPKALLDAAICFDFRPLHGDATLAHELRDWMAARVRATPLFLRHMTEAALQGGVALNRWGRFAVDKEGRLDLKLGGTRVFVDCARIWALAMGVAQTNTAERLRIAAPHLGMSETEVAGAVDAFYLLQQLRLKQWGGATGETPNRLAPGALNRMTRAALLEALRTGRDLQRRLALDYQL